MLKLIFVVASALSLFASDLTPPDRAGVYIKTRTETFNSRYYYALKDGRIWFKPNAETTGKNEPWRLFGKEGLPDNPGIFGFSTYPKPRAITEIYADADELLAVDDTGLFHLKTAKSKSFSSDDLWHEIWGFPKTDRLYHNEFSKEARAITLGRRHGDALWHEDIRGNAHHYGSMGTTTIYVLSKDGRKVRFTDNGLPADFSHSLCLPERGRFVAENLAASASMLFVIDKHGDMRTHLEDYDLNGGAGIFFNYSYGPVPKNSLPGTDPKTTFNTWALPMDNWDNEFYPHEQPRIELKGKARLSKDITILLTGHGNAERELRVAGYDEDGNEGYYFKKIFEREWAFKQADVRINPERLLDNEDVLHPERAMLARSEDERYSGEIDIPGLGKRQVELVDFNLECSPAKLLITPGSGGPAVEAELHTIEAWTGIKRLDPGYDGTPKIMYGTLIAKDPENAPAVLRNRHLDTFAFSVRASTDYIEIMEANAPKGARITGRLVRRGADPNGTFAGLELDTKNVYGAMSRSALEEVLYDPSLIIADLNALKSKDTGLVRAKIKAIADKRESLRNAVDAQNRALQDQKVLASIMTGVAHPVMRSPLTGLDGVPNIFGRGSQMLRMYAGAAKDMVKASQEAFDRVDRVLEQRSVQYERKLEQLRHQLIEEARERHRREKAAGRR